MPRIIKPPTPLDSIGTARSVFLAGSIEMGVAKGLAIVRVAPSSG